MSLAGLLRASCRPPKKNGYNHATSLRRDMDYGDWKHLSKYLNFVGRKLLYMCIFMVLMRASDLSFLGSENGARAYV